jgi:hypothetical protein
MPAPQYVTPDEVMERLRLPAAHADAGYVADCTEAANELVDNYLERNGDPVVVYNEKGHRLPDQPAPYPPLTEPFPRPVWRAALGVAIRVYRFKDAESDVSDTWGDTAALRIPRDPLAGYRDMLNPYRPGAAWAPA